MSIEAMNLALGTAEGILNADWRKWDELASPAEFERWAKSRAYFAATILREALAEQPAQPSLRCQTESCVNENSIAMCKKCVNSSEFLPWAEQPAQQELVNGCVCRWNSEGDRVVTCERHQGWLEVIAEWADRAREAEKKLKVLIASQSAQQEPVAYGMWDTMLGKNNRMMMVRLDNGQDGCTVPLYTSPPAQRTWVGLPESALAAMTLQQVSAMKYAELVLKEKNT